MAQTVTPPVDSHRHRAPHTTRDFAQPTLKPQVLNFPQAPVTSLWRRTAAAAPFLPLSSAVQRRPR
eukprot:358727-Chlamydomonas_euryale.AAC.2